MPIIPVYFGTSAGCTPIDVSAKPVTIGGIEFMQHRYYSYRDGTNKAYYSEGNKSFGRIKVKALSRQGLFICCFPDGTENVKDWLLCRVREMFPDAEGKTDKKLFIDRFVAHMWAYRNVAPHVTREFIRDERRYLENCVKTKK